MSRLTGLLENNHLLVDGAIQPAAGDVSFEDRKEISAVLDYIVTTHGPGDIAHWFGDRWAEIDTFSAEEYRDQVHNVGRTLVRDMMSEMDIEYVSKWNRPLAESEDFYVTVSPNLEVLPLEDADVMVRVHACMSLIEVDGKARTISWDAVGQTFLICAEEDTLVIEMRTWVDELLPKLSGPAGEGTMKTEQARVSVENDRVHAILHVASINGSFVDGKVDIRNMNGMCLIRWKD